MSEPESHVIYEFGDFRLDATRRLLFAKGGSEPLATTTKVFETLLYFVERPGELLEKDRLIAELWPGVVVEESSLTQVISVLRRVLGETRGDNRYLATVHGRGYRFVADVARVLEEPKAGRATPALEPTGPGEFRFTSPTMDLAFHAGGLRVRRRAFRLRSICAVVAGRDSSLSPPARPSIADESNAVAQRRRPAVPESECHARE